VLSTVLRYSGVWTLDGIHCLQKREVTLNLCHGPLQEMHGRQDIAYHKAVPCVYSALRVPMRSNARDHVTMKMATACLVAMATLDACEPRNIVSAASSMDHSLRCTQCANAGLSWVADLGSDAFVKHEIVTPVSSISLPP
jgi:hypothetical protein